MIIRKCHYCGKSKHMSRKQQGVTNWRYRVCYKCQPEMDSGEITVNTKHRVLGSDDGDLKYHQNHSKHNFMDYRGYKKLIVSIPENWNELEENLLD